MGVWNGRVGEGLSAGWDLFISGGKIHGEQFSTPRILSVTVWRSGAFLLESPHPAPFSRSSQSTLRKIQQYIEAHLDDGDLTLRSAARAHLVSARYVNRLFMHEGVSAARIRIRRLERCRADLEDPERRHLSISEIAFDHGFGNISSFNRAFKARFHITPTS
jgi:AraC-like DNA-binding protein